MQNRSRGQHFVDNSEKLSDEPGIERVEVPGTNRLTQTGVFRSFTRNVETCCWKLAVSRLLGRIRLSRR